MAASGHHLALAVDRYQSLPHLESLAMERVAMERVAMPGAGSHIHAVDKTNPIEQVEIEPDHPWADGGIMSAVSRSAGSGHNSGDH
jgi:hypothetical protein